MTDFALVRARVAEVLDIGEDEILPETALVDLTNWDSVNALRLMTNLEAMLRVRLPFAGFAEAKTAGDLCNLVEEVSHARAD